MYIAFNRLLFGVKAGIDWAEDTLEGWVAKRQGGRVGHQGTRDDNKTV